MTSPLNPTDIADAVIVPSPKPESGNGSSPSVPPRKRGKKSRKGKASGGGNFRLTDRDFEILKAVNRYRYLRTGQVKRLFFSEAVSPQTARRRLKNLADSGFRYLGRIEPYVQIGKGNAENAWYLDRGGEELLRAYKVPLASYSRKKSGKVKHHFLAHALDLSEFRVTLELALREYPFVELGRFIADFELKDHTEKAVGMAVFRLYKELRHPVDRSRTYVVHPDALIILRGKGEYHSFQRLYFLEIDRGTETLSVLRDKVVGYSLYLSEGVYRKFGKFDRFRVLFQVPSPTRAENLRKELTGTDGSDLVLITDVAQVTEDALLTKPIWKDVGGNAMALLRTKER